jgi:thiol-disulfide isomerase/thioredoxin
MLRNCFIILFLCCLNTFFGKVTAQQNATDKKQSAEISKSDTLPIPKTLTGSWTLADIPIYSFDDFNRKILQNVDSNYVYVVNFWATWCKPCVEELPLFFELEEKLKHKKVEFIYVSLDFLKQLEKSLVPFLNKNKVRSKVIVLDQKNANEWMEKIEADWSGSIPATLFYNTTSRKFHEGKFDNITDLEKIISSITEK